MKSLRRPTGHKRGGYVLLMTLLVLALMILVLTGIARRSLSSALEAIATEESLRSRWRSISCQRAILQNADILLREDESNAILQKLRSLQDNARDDEIAALRKLHRSIPSRIEFELMFHDVPTSMVLADENCKANLTTIAGRAPAEKAMRLGQALVASPTYRLKPASNWREGSWWHLFEPIQGNILWTDIEPATSGVTNWGNGRINQTRCDDKVFREVAELTLLRNEARALMDARSESPQLSMPQMLEAAQVSADERAELNRRFTDHSDTYSLWIRSNEEGLLEFHTRQTTKSLSVSHSYVW